MSTARQPDLLDAAYWYAAFFATRAAGFSGVRLNETAPIRAYGHHVDVLATEQLAIVGVDRALSTAGEPLRTGAVDVNGGSFNIQAPFGGYKQSGYGRENGPYGIEEFLQTKSLQR